MAADYKTLIANLLAFYDLADKTVIAVGAGGGQLAEYGRAAGNVLAVDNSAPALEKLRESLKAAGLEDKFTPVLGDFYDLDLKADVVLFEFSLHEMRDPGAAVERARRMAPAVVIFDHWPGSEWSYIVAEEKKVAAGWAALGRFPVKKKQMHEAVQFFKDYEELTQKVKDQGETSLARIEKFKGMKDIRIPMLYGFALI
ncbi:MAG: methyltransferase domain-containing protein [Candidatus Aminicenantales bacterium]|jgi:ubiquinone/menaquinone biosynthesis C-methylase UbiE